LGADSLGIEGAGYFIRPTTAKAPLVICFVSWQFGPLGSFEDGALQTPELLKMYGIVYIKGWKCR
jgi:hypothetical protein